MQILLVLLLIPLFWFLLIRPQQQRQREHLALVGSLQVGDRVEGFSGIHGTLREVGDSTVRIEVAEGVVLTMARMAVAARLTEDVDAEDAGVEGSDEVDEGVEVEVDEEERS